VLDIALALLYEVLKNVCKNTTTAVCKDCWRPSQTTDEVEWGGLADTVCLRRPLMTQVQYWSKTAQTDHVTLRP